MRGTEAVGRDARALEDGRPIGQCGGGGDGSAVLAASDFKRVDGVEWDLVAASRLHHLRSAAEGIDWLRILPPLHLVVVVIVVIVVISSPCVRIEYVSRTKIELGLWIGRSVNRPVIGW